MSTVQIQPPASARPAVRPPASEAQPSGEGGDFAQLMALQAPAEEPPQGQRPDDARRARARRAARPMLRQAQAEAMRDKPDVTQFAREGADTRHPAADEAPPLDPALAQWLQGLHRPDASAPPPAADAQGEVALGGLRKQHGLPLARPVTEHTDEIDVTAAAAGHRAGHGAPAARTADKAARETLPTDAAAAARHADESPSALTAATPETTPAPTTAGFTLPAGFEPVAGATPDMAAPAPIETALRAVPMAVPLHSPEFAQAFGLEISTLARDGIQQAELHLNPAEMGPVSVQIALDGDKARIDFGAQAAATRAVIEASLPELAAALRDAGLTLAGGGVSQHAGARDDGRREGRGDSAPFGSRERAEAVAATPARPPLRSRAGPGGVDLYA
ncbi:flagellar hook-length control protein FliK [Piscinibacter aquaticus]|uniref:Flagellar hook-length control protein FliK n=1 Tax=Piscinibacter aquaticus TaxID=392597 RepID=A0A5C6TXQ2_9BURK|nr:flagellar hook-length control protein FliK [Piscinibacter aquaticus]